MPHLRACVVSVLVTLAAAPACSPGPTRRPLPPTGCAVDAVPSAPAASISGTESIRSLSIRRGPSPSGGDEQFVFNADLAVPQLRAPRLFVDVDDDRSSGMWTSQSTLSSSGWDLLVDSDGRLYRHEGQPDSWQWRPLVPPPGYGYTYAGTGLRVCLPASLAGPEGRLRAAVLVGQDEWLPGAFLPGLAFPADAGDQPAPVTDRIGPDTPEPLAFHYGPRPWVVRDCTDNQDDACAAAVYAKFRHVVLASGLEDASHASHVRAESLMRTLRSTAPQTALWGYVSLVGPAPAGPDRATVDSVDELRRRAAAWKAMGATGIFLDEADLCRPALQSCLRGPSGAPVAIDRARQKAVVDAIHALDLPVFANGFAVPDILGPVDGVPSPLGGPSGDRPADMYLLESATVGGGKVGQGLSAKAGAARLELALRWRAATGVRIAAVDTSSGPVPDLSLSLPLYRLGWERAVAARLDAYGFTNASYSSGPDVATNLPLPAAVATVAPVPAPSGRRSGANG